MQISLLSTENLTLPDLLDSNGLLKLLPAAAYDEIPWESLRMWCHFHARYGLPTIETVQWLTEKIGGRRAIEIGSGTGDLAHHLNIHPTDSCQQRDNRLVIAIYESMRQPLIKYPDWVEKLDAVEAVRRHQPEVVVGSWVTQWGDPNQPTPPGGYNMFGVKEDEIIATGATYILIGNRKSHGDKAIMKLAHEEYPLPFLRSRGTSNSQDVIWVWN